MKNAPPPNEPPTPINGIEFTRVRREILRHLLEKNENAQLDLLEITDLIKSFLSPSLRSFTAYAIKDDLEKLDGTFAHHNLTIPGLTGKGDNVKATGRVILATREQGVREQRTKRNAVIKDRIGSAVWHTLLGLQLGDWDVEKELKSEIPTPIKRKIDSLRTKSNLSLFIDSGSTTDAALLALLRVKRIPFITKAKDPDDGDREFSHLVRPHLVTNSPTLAEIVSRSRHGNDLSIRFVGGDLRPDRGSICGALTDMCINAWNLKTDVAIIGTTGLREVDGVPCFGCDDILEARLKGSFMEHATFRIIIFDSSKFLYPEATNVFASLKLGQVDLIVLDEPSDKNARAKDAFKRFIDSARDSHIGFVHLNALDSHSNTK